MKALVVDWLGRGGIAQTTPAWVGALTAAGYDTTVVTRAARELTGSHVVSPVEDAHPLRSHRRVATMAAAWVRDERPDLVVVQNYVVPALERPLDAAVRAVGVRSIVVVHDHRLHSRAAGTRIGLRRRVRAAASVVTHSRFVAGSLQQWSGRSDIGVVPLPAPAIGAGGVPAFPGTDDATAISFGVMKRSYKGTDVVCDLAAAGVPGWRFALAGVGAPEDRPGVVAAPGYLSSPDLAATVGTATAAVLPYRIATQSAAVVLAQHLGVVPIASAVGGIPEQITSGADGLLVPAGASLQDWGAALDRVRADGGSMAAQARARVAAASVVFEELVGALV